MSEVYIRNIANFPLNVGGTNFYGSSGGHQAASIVNGEFHFRNNANGVYVCWSQGGIRYCAKGIDAGSTGESNGSVWVASGAPTSLRFASSSRQYRIDRVVIQNNTNVNLSVAGFSVSPGQNRVLTYATSYTITLDTGDTFSITNPAAGHTYSVTGSYSGGTGPTFSCACFSGFTQNCITLSSDPNNPTGCCNSQTLYPCGGGIGTCSEQFGSGTLWCNFQPSCTYLSPSIFGTHIYRLAGPQCVTVQIDEGSPGGWISGPSLSLLP